VDSLQCRDSLFGSHIRQTGFHEGEESSVTELDNVQNVDRKFQNNVLKPLKNVLKI
jgi:hypothetical protein